MYIVPSCTSRKYSGHKCNLYTNSLFLSVLLKFALCNCYKYVKYCCIRNSCGRYSLYVCMYEISDLSLLFDTGNIEINFLLIINRKIFSSFSVAQPPFPGLGHHIVRICRWHTGRHIQSVGLLWDGDQPIAETSTWQHTTFTRDRQPCSRGDSKLQSQQVSGRRTTT